MAKLKTKPVWVDDIKVLVWDLDGTLYQEISEIKEGIHANAIKLICKTKSISPKKAEKIFWVAYNQVGSSTQALINCGVKKDKALAGKWYSEVQKKYLKEDKDLLEMFKKLKHLRHIISTNGASYSTKEKLKKLGLPLFMFEKIFSNADMFKKLKPDLTVFQAILDYTQLPAGSHLFIGDREETDIEPANKIGMKTCMVWKKSKIADIFLPSVYNIGYLLS